MSSRAALATMRRIPALRVLLASAGLCLGLGFFLPAFDLRRLVGGTDTYSIVAGVVQLARSGSPILAAIVFGFSVVFPIVKLTLMVVVRFSQEDRVRRLRTAQWLSFLGRWSMLDVFVIAILIGAVHLGVLSSASPRLGIYLFGLGILLSMIAAEWIVRRLDLRRAAETSRTVELDRRGLWIPVCAALLFAGGVSLPLMEVEKWVFWNNEYSVVTAVGTLYEEGRAVLGTALAVFVVLLPLVRFVAMAWLRVERSLRERAVRRFLLVDDWAMLDVYVLALLIVATKITDMAGVTPRVGLFLLVASALLSLYDSWSVRSSLAPRDAWTPWR